MPSITTLAPLSPADLRRVLTEVRGALVSQYTALFACSGIEIRLTSAAVDQICKKAAARGGGARGLRGIMVRAILFSDLRGRRLTVRSGMLVFAGDASVGPDV